MAIADTLEAINEAVQNAKDAVVTKGGTVGDTGVAGLADEIGTITGGGGVRPASVWGTVSIYSSYEIGPEVKYPSNCTIVSVDQTKLDSWYASLGTTDTLNFNYSPDEGNMWVCEIFDPQTFEPTYYRYTNAELASTLGIEIELDDPFGYASFSISYSFEVDTTSSVNELDIASETEFLGLGNTGGDTTMLTISGQSIPKGVICWISIGSGVTSLPGYFLYQANHLKGFDWNYYGSARRQIGISCFGSCRSFNTPIIFQNVAIGDNFMGGSSNFNSPIIIKDSSIGNTFLYNSSTNSPILLDGVTSIGINFLSNCRNFNQNLTLPSSLTSIGGSFMSGCDNMVKTVDVGDIPVSVIDVSEARSFVVFSNTVPAYTTGITLAGSTASDWKNAFPDRTTSPFRKLILAS